MERAMEELTMSAPQEDLTGMWADWSGSPRQVIGPCPSPYDDLWRIRYPTDLPGLKSGEFILLHWTRTTAQPIAADGAK